MSTTGIRGKGKRPSPIGLPLRVAGYRAPTEPHFGELLSIAGVYQEYDFFAGNAGCDHALGGVRSRARTGLTAYASVCISGNVIDLEAPQNLEFSARCLSAERLWLRPAAIRVTLKL